MGSLKKDIAFLTNIAYYLLKISNCVTKHSMAANVGFECNSCRSKHAQIILGIRGWDKKQKQVIFLVLYFKVNKYYMMY